jgi:hypothetical protein
MPPAVRQAVEQFGVELALNFTFAMTRDYIPQHYFDMVRPLTWGAAHVAVQCLTRACARADC